MLHFLYNTLTQSKFKQKVMKKNFTRMVAILMIGVSSVAFTGCFGSFGLTTNCIVGISKCLKKKFVNELVFLGLCILPAYELACLGDVLIFNSIEFWGGEDPLAMNEGEVEESQVMYAGNSYTVTKSLNKMSVASQNTGCQS